MPTRSVKFYLFWSLVTFFAGCLALYFAFMQPITSLPWLNWFGMVVGVVLLLASTVLIADAEKVERRRKNNVRFQAGMRESRQRRANALADTEIDQMNERAQRTVRDPKQR